MHHYFAILSPVCQLDLTSRSKPRSARCDTRLSSSNVPQAVRHGILIETANLYENHGDVVVGQAVNVMPVPERLLWPYRALTVC